jgi:8-amino-7-oxononanoate synthase
MSEGRFAPWTDRLAAIRAADQWRTLRTVAPTGPTTGTVDGRPCILACTNDYLGLAWDPTVRAAATGGGAGGSRLISGTRPAHHALEAALEERFGRPALFFPSTWHANLAVLQAAFAPGDEVASDALNHASIIDGLRLGRATRRVVPHADPDAVPATARAVVVEGLFSMDGDSPDLRRYPTAPWLIVDEAHAVGALGPDGRGAAAAQGVTPDVLIGAFGKAYGAAGGFVIGPPALRELLINAGRSFLFTTAPPEPVAALALAGLRAATDERRAALADRVAQLRRGLQALGWSPLGHAHIVPLVVGPNALALAARLLERGVFAPAIRYPTVPRGQERLRFTVSAAHTPTQIDQILAALGPAPAS